MGYNNIPNAINAEVKGCFTTADIAKIKSDRIKFSKEFIEESLKKNPSLTDFFIKYNT